MAGDYTRFRYNPLKDSSGILMQQGRVLLDQDWNEYAQLAGRRWRAETTDVVGRAVVPLETPNGFEIAIAGGNLTIGRGRMYVDGLLAENHGGDPPEFDRVLGELRGTQAIPYDKQPYFPSPPPLPGDTSPHLVYLDVCEREVTYLEDIDLIDKAVGVDTATRAQTVWQVKVLLDTPGGTTCSTPPESIVATAPSAGRLTTAATGVPTSADPCIVPATGGYRGAGNRLYRIEIHKGGALGAAQFKWSRDNASVASAVTAMNAARDTLTVVMTKRDSVLRFQPNDWVEITDDVRYFHGLSGEMAQVAAVNDVNLTIQLKAPLPAGVFDPTKPDRHTRIIRWDQSGIVRDSLGNVVVDVDTNNGLIPVPVAGTTIVLEDGIQATFSIDAAMPVPELRALEYWSFAARVADASVEILTEAPPRGILHHYAWLALVTFPATVTDCRAFWPPKTGESCDCTVCVSAKSHNSGKLTIQMAINQVIGKGGGKICLGPGVYNIDETIMIAGGAAIEIAGHGLPVLQATPNLSGRPMMRIQRAVDIILEDLAFGGGTVGNDDSVMGIELHQTFFVRVKRCAFQFGTDGKITPTGRTLRPAIALTGVVVDTEITDNFFNNVSVAIGDSEFGGPQRLIRALAIEANQMVCANAAVFFTDLTATTFSEIRMARNFAQTPLGFMAIGTGLDVSVTANTFNLIAPPPGGAAPTSAAVVSTVTHTRVEDNEIFGDAKTLNMHGVMLGERGVVMYGTRVTGNRIANLTGHGVSITEGALMLETLIAGNQMLNLGGAGIAMLSSAALTSAAVDLTVGGNSLLLVALRPLLDGAFEAVRLVSSVNVRVSDNAIENMGPDPGNSSIRAALIMFRIGGASACGNRILNIGPPGAIAFGFGIGMAATQRRTEVSGNEVRRAIAPPAAGDASPFASVEIAATDAVTIRGNTLECFGTAFACAVFGRGTCIFSDNQCFFDNPAPGANPVVEIRAGAIIASGNYVQAPAAGPGPSAPVMRVTSTGPHSVIGNIATGGVLVNGAPLPVAPEIPAAGQNLNVVA